MELRTLRYFVTVARERNITRAAEKLNMSQPPLSFQMQKLEEELGVSLFIRGKRQLQLTEEGFFLLRRATQVLELVEKTCTELEEQRQGLSGTLYLGLVEGRAPYLVSEWIARFRSAHPRVGYNLWNGSSDEVLARLGQGLVDLAVIAAPYDTEHLEGVSVGGEPWVAVLPGGHPLAQGTEEGLELARLVGQPLIVPTRKSRVASLRAWFGEIGAEPTILCETSHYIDALALAERGVGIGIFPQTVLYPREGVEVRPITGPARWVEYMLVWQKNQPLSPLARIFADGVTEGLGADHRSRPVDSVLL